MNFIITGRKDYFLSIGEYNYATVDALASLPKIVATDTETPSLTPQEQEEGPFALQLGTGSDNYLLDMETISFEDVRPYLQDKVLIFHNAAFDLGWMYWHWNFWPKEVGDTMLASMILHNGKKERNGAPFRNDFGSVMDREMGLQYDKGEQKNINRIRFSTQRSIQYMFNDVDRLLDLHMNMVQKLIDTEAIPTYRLHRRYIRALAYMEQCGLPVNEEKWVKKIELDKLELAEKEKEVVEYIYANCPKYRDNQTDLFSRANKVTVNLSSTKQMVPIFESFGINVDVPDDKDKTKTKKSTKEEVIKKTKHPFVDLWLEMQGIKHDVSTYGANLLGKIRNEAFYTKFKPCLDTARISTRKEGINIMNFPKGEKTRGCFVARRGFQMVVADYEGQETRTGADITLDPASISFITENRDMHCAFARVLYPEITSLTDQEIKDHHEEKRDAAKPGRFCFQFGGTGYTLHTDKGVPLDEAMKIEAAYRELHYGVYEYGEQKLSEAVELGYILSTSGWRLYLPDYEEFIRNKRKVESFDKAFWSVYKEGKIENKARWDAEEKGEPYKIQNQRAYELYKENRPTVSHYFKKKAEYFKLCLNSSTQTMAAHQTKEAACRIFDYIVRNKHQWLARIAALQHDEVVMEVSDDLTDEYETVVEQAMIEGGNLYLTNNLFEMAAEAHTGPDWHSAKKGKPKPEPIQEPIIV